MLNFLNPILEIFIRLIAVLTIKILFPIMKFGGIVVLITTITLTQKNPINAKPASIFIPENSINKNTVHFNKQGNANNTSTQNTTNNTSQRKVTSTIKNININNNQNNTINTTKSNNNNININQTKNNNNHSNTNIHSEANDMNINSIISNQNNIYS